MPFVVLPVPQQPPCVRLRLLVPVRLRPSTLRCLIGHENTKFKCAVLLSVRVGPLHIITRGYIAADLLSGDLATAEYQLFPTMTPITSSWFV